MGIILTKPFTVGGLNRDQGGQMGKIIKVTKNINGKRVVVNEDRTGLLSKGKLAVVKTISSKIETIGSRVSTSKTHSPNLPYSHVEIRTNIGLPEIYTAKKAIFGFVVGTEWGTTYAWDFTKQQYDRDDRYQHLLEKQEKEKKRQGEITKEIKLLTGTKILAETEIDRIDQATKDLYKDLSSASVYDICKAKEMKYGYLVKTWNDDVYMWAGSKTRYTYSSGHSQEYRRIKATQFA